MKTFFVILCPTILVAIVHGERLDGKFMTGFESEAADTSELKPAVKAAVTNPEFDPQSFINMLHPFTKLQPQPCGAQLHTTVRVNRTMKEKILQSTDQFFSMIAGGGDSELFAVGKGWAGFDPNHLGKFPIFDGHQFAGVKTINAVRNSIRKNSQDFMHFTFNVGIDMRKCWGDTHDLSKREVCGSDVLQRLLEDMAKVEPIFDTTGQSGSTIVTNVEGFIVKNTKDANEYEILREVIPSFGDNIRKRQEFSCYASALAPICVAFHLPTPRQNVRWLAMRKIEIANGESAPVRLTEGDYQVKDIDLKGPKFANSLRDGKTYFGDVEVWAKKDSGFTKMFPQGLNLRGCGSRDAAYTLELDTEVLLSTQMTDYSLYGKFYAAAPEKEYNCVCENAGHPTFPIILDVKNPQPRRIAVGIIDYIERQVGFFDKHLPFSMSTMKKPKAFKEWWMRMWPNYFHLPVRHMKSGLIAPEDHAPAERLGVGQRVRALIKIKWSGGSSSVREDRIINKKHYKSYYYQIPETSAGVIASGSKYKVLAGNEGTIMELGDGYMYIHWDLFASEKKIHAVKPNQIIGSPAKIINVGAT